MQTRHIERRFLDPVDGDAPVGPQRGIQRIQLGDPRSLVGARVAHSRSIAVSGPDDLLRPTPSSAARCRAAAASSEGLLIQFARPGRVVAFVHVLSRWSAMTSMRLAAAAEQPARLRTAEALAAAHRDEVRPASRNAC